MKRIISFLFALLFVISVAAQSEKYNNKIGEVKELNIYGSSKVIIGKIVINQTLVTKTFLLSSSQYKDSSGIYINTFYFGNNEAIPLFGTNILLEFSKPVISVDQQLGSLAMSIGFGLADNNTRYTFKAGQINRPFKGNVLLTITIKSKEKIITTIYGIDGQLK